MATNHNSYSNSNSNPNPNASYGSGSGSGSGRRHRPVRCSSKDRTPYRRSKMRHAKEPRQDQGQDQKKQEVNVFMPDSDRQLEDHKGATANTQLSILGKENSAMSLSLQHRSTTTETHLLPQAQYSHLPNSRNAILSVSPKFNPKGLDYYQSTFMLFTLLLLTAEPTKAQKLQNYLMCSLYADDIYMNHCNNELDDNRPSPDYLERMQSGITPEMRATLVDWMVKVCDDYRFSSDTLYLAVYLVDRFLSKSKIETKQLLLLGTSCILIASKYEERKSKSVSVGQLCMDAKFTKAEVIKMESQVLTSVGFYISVPTCNTFLRRYIQVAQASSEIIQPALEHMACYLAELALASYYFLRHLPSKVAASAVFVAKWNLDPSCNIWDKELADATLYDSQELMDCVLQLRKVYQNSSEATFIHLKYQKEKKRDEMIPDWEEPNKEVTADNSLSVSAKENGRKDVQDNTRETHFSAEGCDSFLQDSGRQAETNGNHFSAKGCDSTLRDLCPQYNAAEGGSTKNEESSAWWTGGPTMSARRQQYQSWSYLAATSACAGTANQRHLWGCSEPRTDVVYTRNV